MMIRVHFAEREPATYDNVTEMEFTAAGAVILRTQPLQSVTDPGNLRVTRTIPIGPPKLLGAWSTHAKWTHVEEVPDEPGAERAPLEVAR
jgi:hypothetical protein